jgi:hypothetical protein
MRSVESILKYLPLVYSRNCSIVILFVVANFKSWKDKFHLACHSILLFAYILFQFVILHAESEFNFCERKWCINVRISFFFCLHI